MSTTSDTPLELTWEWSAGRAPEQRVLVRVEALEDPGGGLLGIRRSPSLANALPDAVALRARILEGPGGLKGRVLRLELPRPELQGVGEGDRAGLGLVAGKVVICVAGAPADLAADEAVRWLSGFECSS